MSGVQIRITDANGRVEDRWLAFGAYQLGREGCDIALGDPNVSSRHARLEVQPGRVTITDVGSTNGTFDSAGNRLGAPHVMQLRQPVYLGGSNVVLLQAAPAAPGGTQVMPQFGGAAPPPGQPPYIAPSQQPPQQHFGAPPTPHFQPPGQQFGAPPGQAPYGMPPQSPHQFANQAFGGSQPESRRLVAGILAILLGSLGIHKFYLGYTTAGIIMLVVTLVILPVFSIITCGAGLLALPLVYVVPIVEGIIYLTKTDEAFIQTYQLNQRPWF